MIHAAFLSLYLSSRWFLFLPLFGSCKVDLCQIKSWDNVYPFEKSFIQTFAKMGFFKVLSSSMYEALHKGCPHIFGSFWPPPPHLSTGVHIWSAFFTPLAYADTLFLSKSKRKIYRNINIYKLLECYLRSHYSLRLIFPRY